MIPYPSIDPIIVRIGPLALRWYGLMYLLGFGAAYVLVRRQVVEENAAGRGRESVAAEFGQLDGMLISLVVGVVLGGRLGYVFFYNFSYFSQHPLEILATWHGGMSFHGGLVGALTAGWLYCRANALPFWKWADRFVVTAPIGLGLGRLGNFINGELFGRPADVPWAMVFPQGGPVPRHPSQLYEAFLEGVLLFALLWPQRHRPWPQGRKVALFFMLYAVCRIGVEFFREPDPQLGFVLSGTATMGQVLSLALLLLGMFLWYRTGRGGAAQAFGQ